jgi:hypothetical protein
VNVTVIVVVWARITQPEPVRWATWTRMRYVPADGMSPDPRYPVWLSEALELSWRAASAGKLGLPEVPDMKTRK